MIIAKGIFLAKHIPNSQSCFSYLSTPNCKWIFIFHIQLDLNVIYNNQKFSLLQLLVSTSTGMSVSTLKTYRCKSRHCPQFCTWEVRYNPYFSSDVRKDFRNIGMLWKYRVASGQGKVRKNNIFSRSGNFVIFGKVMENSGNFVEMFS